MHNNRGFSLLELLIVVAIILIIATIAIPNLLRSRQAAAEIAAVSSLKAINAAEISYLSTLRTYGALSDLIAEGLIDTRFAGGSVSGYNFSIAASGTDYTATAMPASSNSGRFAYFTLPDAVVRYSTGATGCGGAGGACYPPGMSGQPVQ